MAIRVIKSSGDVYADLGIRKRRSPRHGSTLDSFLTEGSAKRQTKGRSKRRYKSRMKAALHETTEDLFLAGMISEKRMKAYDDLCLTKAGKATVLARRQRRKSRAGVAAGARARNRHHDSTLDSSLKEERGRK